MPIIYLKVQKILQSENLIFFNSFSPKHFWSWNSHFYELIYRHFSLAKWQTLKLFFFCLTSVWSPPRTSGLFPKLSKLSFSLTLCEKYFRQAWGQGFSSTPLRHYFSFQEQTCVEPKSPPTSKQVSLDFCSWGFHSSLIWLILRKLILICGLFFWGIIEAEIKVGCLEDQPDLKERSWWCWEVPAGINVP